MLENSRFTVAILCAAQFTTCYQWGSWWVSHEIHTLKVRGSHLGGLPILFLMPIKSFFLGGRSYPLSRQRQTRRGSTCQMLEMLADVEQEQSHCEIYCVAEIPFGINSARGGLGIT